MKAEKIDNLSNQYKEFYYTAEPDRKGEYRLFLHLIYDDHAEVYENPYYERLTRGMAGFLRAGLSCTKPDFTGYNKWLYLETVPA